MLDASLEQVLYQVLGPLVALPGVLGHQAAQDGGHLVGDVRVELARVDGRHLLVVVQLAGGPANRGPSGRP